MNTRMRFQKKATQVPQTASLLQPPTFDADNTDQPILGHDFSQVRIHAPVPETMKTKMAINQPVDSYEQEAERVAEQVIQMDAPGPSETPPGLQDINQHTEFVAAGTSDTAVISSDGINWTSKTPGSGNIHHSVASTASQIVVGGDTGTISTSP